MKTTERPYSRIEIEGLYENLGADLTGKKVNKQGWIIIKSPLRDDKHPSFGLHLDTGNWIDHGRDGMSGNVEEAYKQYFNYGDHEMTLVYDEIRKVLSTYRKNLNFTGGKQNHSSTQSSNETPDYTQTISHSQDDEPDRVHFWEEKDDMADLVSCAQLLKEGGCPELVDQVEKYDLITKTTLEDYHCGVTEFNGENYIQIPYYTGAQLYCRDAKNVKKIRQIPESKPKESFFGEEQILGSETLHFCKSPREAMLLSQHTEDDCIGICAGENADLSDHQKHILHSQFRKGCAKVIVYFDCDTDDALNNAHRMAESIKRINAGVTVQLANIHKASNGISKDLTDWFKDGHSLDDLNQNGLEEISFSQKNDQSFWEVDKRGKVQIDELKFYEMLESHGFMKTYFGQNPVSIRNVGSIISETNQPQLSDFVRELLKNIPDRMLKDESGKSIKTKVVNSFIKHSSRLLSETGQIQLKTSKLDIMTDEKNIGYLFFNNGVARVGKQSADLIDYEKLDGVIWKEQVINRDVHLDSELAEEAVFKKFIDKLTQGIDERRDAIESSLGYLMHTHKDKAKAKAIILVDEKLVGSTEEAHGGTGKSLLLKSLDYVRQFNYVQGKNYHPSHRFAFQSVNLGDQVLLIDDVRPEFDFEGLFNIITDDMSVERKNSHPFKIPFEQSPKIAITTNTSIGGSGNSFERRENLVELPDYFNKDRKVDDEFGHTFFDDWDDEEWNKFYNYMIYCMQQYLRNGLSGYEKNYRRKKLTLETSPEMIDFYENEVDLDVEYDKTELCREFNLYRNFFDTPMQQAQFTSQIKKCGDADPKVGGIRESKSGSKRFIEFISVDRLKQIDDNDDSDEEE